MNTLKKKIIIASLFVLSSIFGSMYVNYHQQKVEYVHAAGGTDVMGYLWSSSIGWISLSCANPAISTGCSIPYQVTQDPGTGEWNGKAWSDTVGWLSFDPEITSDFSGLPVPPPALACPVGAIGPCEAKMNANRLEGWARFQSANGSWDGWVSLSSDSYMGSAPSVSYGSILSTLNITDAVAAGVGGCPITLSPGGCGAWGSSIVGWLSFIGVTLAPANINVDLHLKPSTNSSLGAAAVLATPDTISVPGGTGAVELYWYTTDPTAVYVLPCEVASVNGTGSSSASTWTSYPVAAVPKNPPGAGQTNVTLTHPTQQTYTLGCTRQSGQVDYATATVNITASSPLILRAALPSVTLNQTSIYTAGEPLNITTSTPQVRLFWAKSALAPNYTSCKIDGITVALATTTNPLSSKFPVIPALGSQTYVLTCTDGIVSHDAEATVIQTGNCTIDLAWGSPAPPSSPPPCPVPVELTWDPYGAASCSGSWTFGSISPGGGAALVSPPLGTSTDYTINCSTPAPGSSNCSETITADYSSCTPLYQCNDSIDNDGDTFTDFPNDPGCTSLMDNSEANVAPACSDGIDNDGDGKIDFDVGTQIPPGSSLVDPGCTSALDKSEKAGIIIEE